MFLKVYASNFLIKVLLLSLVMLRTGNMENAGEKVCELQRISVGLL